MYEILSFFWKLADFSTIFVPNLPSSKLIKVYSKIHWLKREVSSKVGAGVRKKSEERLQRLQNWRPDGYVNMYAQ